MSENIDTDTVYVTTHEDSRAMSEKVQTLAGSIYKEFEKVIKKYDEDVVKDLMPLVVGILEALDAAFGEKQELDVEIELLREDNEQLLTQYEREKQLRKGAEQKYLEMEDSMEDARKELEDKVETLESILRMSEIKSKNSADLVSRLEEREQEAKNEYNKLHDRYTELFRSHMDHMERTKVLLGTDKLSELTATTSPRITKAGFNLRPANVMYGNTIEHHQHHGMTVAVDGDTHPPGRGISLLTELNAQQLMRGDLTREDELTDSINVTERATNTRLNQTLAEIIASTPELEESHDSLRSLGHLDEHHNPSHNNSSMFEEIQATDIAEVDFAAGISEQPAHEGQNTSIDSDKEDEEEDEESKDNDRDSVGDNFFGMCKELENLILENTELLATKNALNIVKDDLIAKIDILTSEQDVLREEIVIHNSVRKKLQDRIVHLEDELKKLKEDLEVKTKEPAEKEAEEGDVPMAQRKRFTRVEMARVLMERNQYKERLMELQEAVRWTELVRASKEHPGELETKKKSGVWNFFSELVLPSQTVSETSILAHKQMPSRHRNTLNAVLNPSLHHKPSPSPPSSSYSDDSPPTVSLLQPPSSSPLSSLPHITLLPPHTRHSMSSTQAATVPVVLATPLPNLPPTPSGEPAPCFFQSPLPAPFTHTPHTSSLLQSPLPAPFTHTPHTSSLLQSPLPAPFTHTPRTSSLLQSPLPAPFTHTPHTSSLLQSPLPAPFTHTPHTSSLLQSPLPAPFTHTPYTSSLLQTPESLTLHPTSHTPNFQNYLVSLSSHTTHTPSIFHTPAPLTTSHTTHTPTFLQTSLPLTPSHIPLHLTHNHTTHTPNILHTPLNLTSTHTSNIPHTPHHLTPNHAPHNLGIPSHPLTNKPTTLTHTKASPLASSVLTPTLPGIQVPVDHPVQHFFGSLFSSSSKPAKQQAPTAAVKPSSSTLHFQSSEDSSHKHRGSLTRSNTYDFQSDDFISEKSKEEREKERREQYKQVRALVKKDDGRMQAYGWSLPAKFTASIRDTDRFQLPVPVPVYCRPLFDSDTDWKIWCAAGVNLTGWKSTEAGSGVNFSVSPPEPSLESQTEGDNLHQELKDQELRGNSDVEQMSSLVWVCTANHDASQVSVIDANNPADILETFSVSVSHILSIASVPGVQETDYPVTEETLAAGVVVKGDTVEAPGSRLADVNQAVTVEDGQSAVEDDSLKLDDNYDHGNRECPRERWVLAGQLGDDDSQWAVSSSELPQPRDVPASGAPASSPTSAPPSDLSANGRSLLSEESEVLTEGTQRMSSVLPTMWMGTHNGSIYVHSSLSDWRRCIHSVKLKDSVLAIVHVKGRVLASLSDGTIAIFHRATDGQWDLVNYHLIVAGQASKPVRCMTVVGGRRVWCSYRNKIHIVCPLSMIIQKTFDAHPRNESVVKQMCWVGDGVWVSIRLDSSLRLYHAYTHQHLQDVDVEPYVTKMLGPGQPGFSFIRLTAMLISCNRLWIGTGNGVIMSVPLSENNKQPMIATSTSTDSGSRPGGVVRVYSDTSMESSASSTFIPYCSMAHAQLSFHGHKDAVKFFAAVPGIQRQRLIPGSNPPPSTLPPRGEAVPAPPSNSWLILAGGEGYVDFRLGVGDDGDAAATTSELVEDSTQDTNKVLTRSDSSHIIVWQVTQE